MTNQEREQQKLQSLKQTALVRLQYLDGIAHGVTMGLILGLGLFFATNWLVVKGGSVIGPHLSLLGQYFIGYRPTFWGSFVGFGYGFATGFVGGYLFTLIYNRVTALRDKARTR